MTFPTPYTVGWHTASDGTVDARGNPSTVYTPALKSGDDLVDGKPVDVISIAPAGSFERNEVRVEHDLELLVPPGVTGKPKDVVDVPFDRSIGRFEVDGFVDDWNYGFHGWQPGSVVKLKRVEG